MDACLDALATAPVPVHAAVVAAAPSHRLVVVHTRSSQRVWPAREKAMVVRDLVLTRADDRAWSALAGTPADLRDVVLRAWTPGDAKERRCAVLRASTLDGKPLRLLELWNHAARLAALPVTDTHDDFYADSVFGQLAWSADAASIIYLAAPKPDHANDDPYHKDARSYALKQDWGEKYSGKPPPALFVAHWASGAVQCIPLPAHLSPAQPQWLGNGQSLVFCAYTLTTPLYGVYACPNRPAAIYRVNIDGSDLVQLSLPQTHARSPRLLADQRTLLYLSNDIGGAHAGCSKLIKMDLVHGTRTVLVPMVPRPIAPAAFPGLFTDALPTQCEVTLSKTSWLVCNTQWRSTTTIIAVHEPSGRVVRLAEPSDQQSYSLLAVWEHYLVASRSSLSCAPELVWGELRERSLEEEGLEVNWSVLDAPASPQVHELLGQVEWKVMHFPERHHALECIYVTPRRKPHETPLGGAPGAAPPLLIFPHGGPHVAFSTAFSPLVASLCLLGFAVALVNYRGSTGFGQEAVTELLGRVGEADVEDVHYVATALQARERVDAARMCVTGGSHGGFLAAHLIARYPTAYKACVMRNPVINLGGLALTNDIPDWNFAEAGLPYAFDGALPIVTPSMYTPMFEASPIKHVAAVQAPTLVMLGERDRRVSSTEGQLWYYAAKRQGLTAACRVYPGEGHALDGVVAERTGWRDMCAWFVAHVGAARE